MLKPFVPLVLSVCLLITLYSRAQQPAAPSAPTPPALAALEEVIDILATQSVPATDAPSLRAACVRAMAPELKAAGIPVPPPEMKLDAATAASLFEQWSHSPGQLAGGATLADRTIANYCTTVLDFAEYLPASIYQEIKQRQQQSGAGLGITLTPSSEGYLCYPLPDSPASLAGVQPGDLLISLEGREVKGQPLKLIAAWGGGQPGSMAQMRVKHSFGRTELLQIRRESFSAPSTRITSSITGMTVRVLRFSATSGKNEGLAATLRTKLSEPKPVSLLTLDLRGCGGGELDEAVAVAGLFLGPGKLVVTQLKREGTRLPMNTSGAAVPQLPKQIIIQQDHGTASAAEVLIAALTHHLGKQVITRGSTTYGKAVADDQKELKSGGYLRFPIVALEGPNGEHWGGKGLTPTMQDKR